MTATSGSNIVRIGSFEVSRPIAFTYLLAIFYNVTFFLQFSATPYLIKQLQLSDAEFGYIQTIFGVFQMVGGPLFGYIIQKFGIRYALHLCYFSTLLSGLALFFSFDFYSLLLSRIPVVFMHGQQAHQTLLSALTQPGKERTSAFGRMGLTFGIGFIFVPIFSIAATKIGGDLAPFLVSAALCAIPSIVLETCIERKSYEHEISEDKSSDPEINITNVVRILQKPGVLNVMAKKNGGVVPFLMIIAVLNLYIIEKFNATNTENQIMQMMMGVFIMFSNGFGVIWLRKKFDEQTLLIIGSMSFVLGYTLFTLVFFNFWMLLVIMPFVSLGMSVVATCSDSLLTALVDESEQGIILGTATSINSLVRTFSPLFAGYLLQNYGFQSLTILGVFGSLSAIGLMIMSPVDENLIKKHK
uniref:MFS domain-containing protein n=1 Tax=Caenorhabditis tropicalis TaxID=1561998 RepID=A0A1I7TQX0_9PELO